MKNKKRLLYIIAAVFLVLAGLYLEHQENDDNNTVQDPEEGYVVEANTETLPEDYVAYYFRNDDLLEQHYEKHGMEMGFESMEAYEEAACAVIYHPDVLTKTEKEDGDYVYYIEESNEFVVISQDGYIRTYFHPSAGIDYYNRQ